MLTDRELTQLRADMVELLPGTAVISRYTSSVDSAGVAAQTFAAVGTVICRVDPASGNDVRRGVLAGREATTTFFQLTLEWDADIAEGDRVTFGGETMEITLLHDLHEKRAVRRALLARIEGA